MMQYSILCLSIVLLLGGGSFFPNQGSWADASHHHSSSSSLAKENPMKSNKTPKSAQVFTDSCEECQTIIRKMVEVAKDPAKLEELKVILEALCTETSYAEECRLFVSKLDLFIEKLLPYLRNPLHVCQKLHICSNAKIEQFHRVGLIFAQRYLDQRMGAGDLICEECQFAAQELLKLVDDPNYQKETQDWVSANVCGAMGHYRGMCDEMLEQYMPEFWAEMHNMLSNGKQFCVELELCEPTIAVPQPVQQRQFSSPTVNVPTARSNVKVSKGIMNTFFNH